MSLEGFSELRSALRQLPDDLADEAGTIVQAAADEAKAEIQGGYPEGPTGNLRRGVTRDVNRNQLAVSALVRSRARHASIFEKGTRQRVTSRGANRGRMPEASQEQAFIPKAIRARRRMQNRLIELVRRAGFVVNE